MIVRDSVPLAYQSQYWGAEPVEGNVLVNRLSEMVERSIALYERNNPETPLPEEAPLYVCGSPVSREPEVSTQIATNLQRPLGEIAAPAICPPDFPMNDLVVNLGLVLER